jgi:UDP-N-acetylmuramoyl-tripeptide--D-alanyl-D-alanine ligase
MSASWGHITAGEIASVTGGRILCGPAETVFPSLSTDSRKIRQGELFWALKGERYDGHGFVEGAVRQGAAGAVIESGRMDPASLAGRGVLIEVPDTLHALGDLAGWWRHQYPIVLAAITGSMGKTTTKAMTSRILGIRRKTLSNEGNFNNLVGLPLSLLRLNEAHGAVVLEMGMNRRGEIGRLTEIADPEVGLITNVGRVHLEGLGDIQGVARAKVELVERMSERGTAILNGDDELLMRTALPFERRKMTFGLESKNDVQGRNVRDLGRDGLTFDLCYQGESTAMRLRLPGRHHVMNGLAASAVALSFGESFDCIAQGLSAFEGIPGRFAISDLAAGALLVDDTYNSNPSSLRAALQHIRNLVPEGGRLIVGLGDMLELGAETDPAHLEAGEIVAKLGADLFLALGEHAGLMIRGAVEHGLPRSRSAEVSDHEEMVRSLQKEIRKGDLIFLKGSRRIGLDRVARGLRNGKIEGGKA